jgi:uncharacterized integral membrane protein
MPRPVAPRTKTMWFKLGLWLLLVAALLIVVLQNRAPVQTQFLLVTLEMPHILLLALTALGGFVVGLVAPALWRGPRVWPRPGRGLPEGDDGPAPGMYDAGVPDAKPPSSPGQGRDQAAA